MGINSSRPRLLISSRIKNFVGVALIGAQFKQHSFQSFPGPPTLPSILQIFPPMFQAHFSIQPLLPSARSFEVPSAVPLFSRSLIPSNAHSNDLSGTWILYRKFQPICVL